MRSTIEKDQLLIDGAPYFMLGAEMHYFRIERDAWAKHMACAAECGMNTITACIPWHFHEPEEGQFDFTGSTHPERDLRGFIERIHDAGLKMLAHPGPFLNCEFRTGGIPEWLFRNHPETMSRRADRHQVTGRPVPAEGEPLYRQYVEKWYSRVVPFLAEYQIDKGGPIILFQADNELSAAWSFGLLNSLYDPHTTGELWPQWLHKTYKDIAHLNHLYQTKFKTFAEVTPPRAFPSSQHEKVHCVDWLHFKRWFFADWGATLANWGTNYGITTPTLFNEPVAGFYGHGDHAGFGRILRDRGISGMTVCHSYSERILDLDGIVNPSLGVELVKSSPWGGPALSVEVNCNWFMPRLSRSALNWDPLLRCLLGHGLKGYSVFTFSEGKADLDDSIEGPDYFAGSGLDHAGNKSTAYPYLEKLNRLVETWKDLLLASDKADDVTLCYSPTLRLSDFLGATPCGEKGDTDAVPGGNLFDAEPGLDRGNTAASHDWLDGYENVSKQGVPAEAAAWSKFREAYVLLTRLNLSFNLLDLTNPNTSPGTSCLVVPCVGSLEKESIDFLLEHIKAGGKILFFPTIPVYDMNGQKDDRIAETLGIKLKAQIRPAGGTMLDYGARRLQLPNGRDMTTPGWIWVHDFPEECETLATFDQTPVAAKTGNIVVAGFDARFTTNATLSFWRDVAQHALDVTPTLKTEHNYHYAQLLQGEAGGLLVVMNITGNRTPAWITLKTGLQFELELGEYEARAIPVNACLNGKTIRYATSEVIRSGDGQHYELHGQAGTHGRIVFAEAYDVTLNGEAVELNCTDDGYSVEYEHESHPLKLIL